MEYLDTNIQAVIASASAAVQFKNTPAIRAASDQQTERDKVILERIETLAQAAMPTECRGSCGNYARNRISRWNPKERRDRSRRDGETRHRFRSGIPRRKEWLRGHDADW